MAHPVLPGLMLSANGWRWLEANLHDVRSEKLSLSISLQPPRSSNTAAVPDCFNQELYSQLVRLGTRQR